MAESGIVDAVDIPGPPRDRIEAPAGHDGPSPARRDEPCGSTDGPDNRLPKEGRCQVVVRGEEEWCLLEELEAELEKLVRQHAELFSADPDEERVTVARIWVGGILYCLIRDANPVEKHLTERQKKIIHLVAEGLPNKAIASRLGIHPATVASHLVRLFRKFNVDSRAALARHSPFLQ
jgi:DNA-binding CsgD family transcriptional regulator